MSARKLRFKALGTKLKAYQVNEEFQDFLSKGVFLVLSNLRRAQGANGPCGPASWGPSQSPEIKSEEVLGDHLNSEGE